MITVVLQMYATFFNLKIMMASLPLKRGEKRDSIQIPYPIFSSFEAAVVKAFDI